MAKTYKVIAPLVIAKNDEGSDVYLYREAQVPEGQSKEWIDQHLADNMIAEGASSPADDSDAADKASSRRSSSASS